MSEMLRKEEYHFRVVGLEKALADQFEKVLRPRSIEKKQFNDPEHFVTAFLMENGIDYDAVADFLHSSKIPESKYGIFATLTTNKDIDGLEFPPHVVRFHKMIGGNIDVSFLYSEL